MLPAALSIVMNMFEEGAERNKALGSGARSVPAARRSGWSPAGLLTRYAGCSTSSI